MGIQMKGSGRLETVSELVIKAKEGDTAAFSELYQQIYKDMYRYAYYMLENRQEAEDMVSDTVIEVYQGIRKLRGNEKFRAWVFKILSNKCRARRKQLTKKYLSLDDESVNRNLKTVNEYEKEQDLKHAFEELTSEERDLVSMAVFGGYKSWEIGELMNMKAATVRSKISRAFAKMQKRMEVQL
ncbi:MAG: RNA polymerase sigma factor [Lachnospiraceae bacterium]|nr:RNA polymerase sigma factor [Lachnospiraceae bacterium]